jgi:hypothetical protein
MTGLLTKPSKKDYNQFKKLRKAPEDRHNDRLVSLEDLCNKTQLILRSETRQITQPRRVGKWATQFGCTSSLLLLLRPFVLICQRNAKQLK